MAVSTLRFETNLDKDKPNEYLYTLIAPWKHPGVRLPDLDNTAGRNKSITLTNDLTVQKPTFVFVFVPQNQYSVLRLYALTTIVNAVDPSAHSGYIYVMDIPVDENLSQSYVYGRLISAGLHLSSATRPSGTVDINGMMNAIQYQDIPSFKALTFSSIPSFRRDDTNVKTQISVVDGVTTLAIPFGESTYRNFVTNAVEHTENLLDISTSIVNPFPAGVLAIGATAQVALLSVGNAAGSTAGYPLIPEGIWGHVLFQLQTQQNSSPAIPYGWTINVTIYAPALSTADWNTPLATTGLLGSTRIEAGGNSFIKIDSFTPAELRYIQITITNNTAAATDPSVAMPFMTLNLSLRSATFYDKGWVGPGSIIGFNGMNVPTGTYPGQVVALSGKFNYEVVPNSSLARQVKTDYSFKPENPLMIKAAQYYIARDEIPFLYVKKDYERLDILGRLESQVSNAKVAEAAGLGDFLSSLLKATRPILSAVPVVGDVVNALLPSSAAGVYSMPTQSAGVYSADSQYRYPTNPPRRFNAAYVGGYADEIADTEFSVVEKKAHVPIFSPEQIAELASGALIKDAASAGSINMGFMNGLISQVNYGFVANRFLLIETLEGGKKRVAIGYVFCSSQPLLAEYSLMSITLASGDTINITVASNATLSADSLYALATASKMAGYPSDFITVYSPFGGIIQGTSLGLAAFVSMTRRNTYAILSGFLDTEGEAVAISELDTKISYLEGFNEVVNKGVPIITPYDDVVDSPMIKGLRERGLVVDTYATCIGELGVTGLYPQVIFAKDVASVMLASLMINGLAARGRWNVGSQIPNITIFAATLQNAPAYVATKQFETYNWGYGEGDSDTLIKYVNSGDFKEIIKQAEELYGYPKGTSTHIERALASGNWQKVSAIVSSLFDFMTSVAKNRVLGLVDKLGQPVLIQGKKWSLEQAEAWIIDQSTKRNNLKEYATEKGQQTLRKHGSALHILANILNTASKAKFTSTTFAAPARRQQGKGPIAQPPVTTSTTTTTLTTTTAGVAPSSLIGDIEAPTAEEMFGSLGSGEEPLPTTSLTTTQNPLPYTAVPVVVPVQPQPAVALPGAFGEPGLASVLSGLAGQLGTLTSKMEKMEQRQQSKGPARAAPKPRQ